MNYREIATEIHEQNVKAGWWGDWPNKWDRYELGMLLSVSELIEAMNGIRKGWIMDDHLPDRPMFHVEIADTIIRVLDMAGALNVKLGMVDDLKDAYVLEFREKGKDIPRQLWDAVSTSGKKPQTCIRRMLAASLAIAEFNHIDIWRIVAEKRAYNAKRADHKRENREAAGGKAF